MRERSVVGGRKHGSRISGKGRAEEEGLHLRHGSVVRRGDSYARGLKPKVMECKERVADVCIDEMGLLC